MTDLNPESTPMPRSNEYRTPTAGADTLWAAIRQSRSQAEDRSMPQAIAVGNGGVSISGGALVVRDPSGQDRVRVGPISGGRYGVEVFDPATGRWASLS